MSLLDVICFFLVPCWCCRLSSSELLKLLLSDAYLLRRWKKTGTGRASHHSSVSTIAALRSCDYLQILTANTRLQKDLLDASNKACAEAAELEALSRQQLQHMLDSSSQQLEEKNTKEVQHEEEEKAKKQQQQQMQGKEAGSDDNMEKNAAAGPSKEETAATITAATATAEGGRTQREDEDLRLQQQPVLITLEKVAEAGAVVMKEKRELLESQMKRCRMLLDACNGLIVDLDSLDFSTLKPLWGDERSVRQSRKCLTQLIEKMTDRLEVANKFLKNIFIRLPPPPSSPLLDSSRSRSNASQGVPHRGPADTQAAAVAGTAANAGTEASAGRAATAAGGAAAEFVNGSPDGVCASATKKGASAASLPSPSATAMTSSFLLPTAIKAASSFSSVSTTEAAAASERRDSTDEPTGLKAGDLRGSEPGSPSVVGRGRGVLPGVGTGRGRGVLLAAGRGRGAGAGRGASSPSSSSSSESDDDSDRQQQAQPTGGRRSSSSTGLGSNGGRRGLEASADTGNANTAPAAAATAATATAGGSPLSPKKRSRYDETQQQQQGEEEEEEEKEAAAAAAAEHHRVNSRSARDREEGDMPPSRWKRKQAANVDWLLKCRTKLCELKERTVRKAVSDVFIKERTVQETIEFMNHNADKLQTVAEKPKAAITSDDRRIFMRSIESYIAGLDKACSLVAKQAMNKRQLMSLFESACKVEKFQTPHELLVEVKNTVSLLQTFAYMPPSRDDDSS